MLYKTLGLITFLMIFTITDSKSCHIKDPKMGGAHRGIDPIEKWKQVVIDIENVESGKLEKPSLYLKVKMSAPAKNKDGFASVEIDHIDLKPLLNNKEKKTIRYSYETLNNACQKLVKKGLIVEKFKRMAIKLVLYNKLPNGHEVRLASGQSILFHSEKLPYDHYLYEGHEETLLDKYDNFYKSFWKNVNWVPASQAVVNYHIGKQDIEK